MDKPTCAVSDCIMHVFVRGVCHKHYEDERIANAEACSEPGCEIGALVRGLCRGHYLAILIAEHGPCRIDGCSRKISAKGLCGAHYKQARRLAGSPCEVVGCLTLASSMHLCSTHYTQISRRGAPVDDAYLCAACGITVSRRESKTNAWAILCTACRLLRGNTTWCMTVEKLAERDGLACAECGEIVDMTLRRPDLMSPSVDHVIPRSRGGQDLPGNLALTHFLCNLRKGSRAKETA